MACTNGDTLLAILEKYRRDRSLSLRGYRRALVLMLFLAVVLALMVMIGIQARESVLQPSASPPPAPAAPSPDVIIEDPLPDWAPLSPKEERALLGKITDQAPLGVRENREAYYYLLNKVRRMSDTELAERVDRKIQYEDFQNQGDIIRGSVVEVTGTLLRIEETELDYAQAGLRAIYEGQIMTADGALYSFSLTMRPQAPFAPGKVGVRDALPVRLRGIFMQVIVYENRENPPKQIATPLIIGRSLTHIRLPPRPRGSFPWFTVSALLALAAGLAFTIVATLTSPRRKHTAPKPEDVPRD